MSEFERTIYLDADFCCHAEPGDGLTPYVTDFFYEREEEIPNYRIVPAGAEWTRSDGVVFYGEMIAPIGKLG